jgi:hypothetical protein
VFPLVLIHYNATIDFRQQIKLKDKFSTLKGYWYDTVIKLGSAMEFIIDSLKCSIFLKISAVLHNGLEKVARS